MDMPVEEAQAQESAVLSTAALPYVPVYPAPNHLAWSDDFQACAVTRHEIHLLVLHLGPSSHISLLMLFVYHCSSRPRSVTASTRRTRISVALCPENSESARMRKKTQLS